MEQPTELHLAEPPGNVRRLRVRVLEGPDRDRAVEHHGGRLSVGTSPDNELTLTDPTVSHYHLELRCEGKVVVRDLGSRNGTFVGDLRIREAMVPLGTKVRVGRTVLAVESALAMGSINLEELGQPAPLSVSEPLPPYRAARAEALAAFERTYLRKLIEATGGNASAAARAANMDRPYLLSLLRRHGLR